MKRNLFLTKALQSISRSLTNDGAWLAVGIAIASVPCMHFLNSYRNQYQEIANEYRNALNISKQQVVETFWQLGADSKLGNSISESQQYSLKQSLSTFLGYGKVDAIAFFSPSCQLLASTAIKNSQPAACNPNDQGLSWQEGGNFSHLLLSQKIQLESGGPFFAVAQVQLDNDWLRQFPKLAYLLKKYQFTLVPDKSEPRLQSEHWYFKYFTNFATPLNELHNYFFWPFVLLAIAFLAITSLGRQQKWQRRRELLEKFESWCRELSLPFAEESFAIDPALDRELSGYFIKVGKILERKVNAVVLDLGKSEERLKQALDANASLKADIVKMREKFMDGVGHESLAIQVQQIALPFSERLYNADDQGHVVLQLLQKQLLVHSNSLFELLMEWKKGIAQKGARKFVRSLYEQASENSEKDLLSVYLERFLLYSSKIGDAAIQSCLQMKKIQPTYSVGAKILANWYSLALNDRLELNKKAMILDSLKSVKGMLEGIGIVVRWKLMQPELLISEMPLPEGVLISAFYHILFAFLQHENASPVVIELRREGTRNWLYFWHPQLAGGDWERGSRMLSLARHLIEGHGLTLQHVDQPKGQMLFISWNEESPRTQAKPSEVRQQLG